jgi:triosephosphate isomerase
MRRALVAGNWKMNGSRDFVRRLLADVVAGLPVGLDADVLVCPPHVYLDQARQALAGSAVSLGAQNTSEHPSGAFTGEVSVDMLSDVGCGYVIVGHSERRTLYGETDDQIARKFEAVRTGGLKPILCVGETLDERESGATESVVARQLNAVVEHAGAAAFADAVVAYEPVWAIGTGRTATPEQAQAVHAFIRARMAERDKAVAEALPILYGGSVKGDNAAELFGNQDIDGGLIGGASLAADGFLAICRAAGR